MRSLTLEIEPKWTKYIFDLTCKLIIQTQSVTKDGIGPRWPRYDTNNAEKHGSTRAQNCGLGSDCNFSKKHNKTT